MEKSLIEAFFAGFPDVTDEDLKTWNEFYLAVCKENSRRLQRRTVKRMYGNK